MKKKYPITSKDKKDWITFTKRSEKIYNKDDAFVKQNTIISKTKRLDLHGLSLNQANKIVKKFIIESFDNGYKKLLIVTGKGLRSKSYDNPYVSEQLSVLKNSVPEFIKNNEDLSKKISSIATADLKDGGDGAFYIFLKR